MIPGDVKFAVERDPSSNLTKFVAIHTIKSFRSVTNDYVVAARSATQAIAEREALIKKMQHELLHDLNRDIYGQHLNLINQMLALLISVNENCEFKSPASKTQFNQALMNVLAKIDDVNNI